MRQAGYLAAAGSYALKYHRKDLNTDHKKAKEIAITLKKCIYVNEVNPVETNIIIFSLKKQYDEVSFVQKLKNKNILILSLGKGKLRMVTHRDYTDDQHSYLLKILSKMEYSD